jgi:DNA polymerase sigma
LEPSAEATAKQQAAFERLVGLLKQKWPEAKVSLFGSAASQLAVSGNNDIDVCLELDGVENTREAKGGAEGNCIRS